jgi:predicted nucleic acid-binding protein
MAIVCLDTDIVIDIIRGKRALSDFLSITSRGTCTTTITTLELYYGAYKSGKESNVVLIDSLNVDIAIADIEYHDMKLAGRIMAELEKSGKKLEFRDVLIGAICINRGFSILTRNKRHFERLREYGLSIENF